MPIQQSFVDTLGDQRQLAGQCSVENEAVEELLVRVAELPAGISESDVKSIDSLDAWAVSETCQQKKQLGMAVET